MREVLTQEVSFNLGFTTINDKVWKIECEKIVDKTSDMGMIFLSMKLPTLIDSN